MQFPHSGIYCSEFSRIGTISRIMTYFSSTKTYYKLIMHWCLTLLGLKVVWRIFPIWWLISLTPTLSNPKLQRHMPLVEIMLGINLHYNHHPDIHVNKVMTYWLLWNEFFDIHLVNGLNVRLVVHHSFTKWFIPHKVHLFLIYLGVGYSFDKWPRPLQLSHHMLVLSSVGCRLLLAPIVILILSLLVCWK